MENRRKHFKSTMNRVIVDVVQFVMRITDIRLCTWMGVYYRRGEENINRFHINYAPLKMENISKTKQNKTTADEKMYSAENWSTD